VQHLKHTHPQARDEVQEDYAAAISFSFFRSVMSLRGG
jgi:hypothetical protein